MKAINEKIDKWMAGEMVGKSKFKLNDCVKIKSGEYIGAVGSVISLVTVDSDPIYLIELGTGKDVHIKQSEILSMHERAKKIKGVKFSEEDVKILTTRIISMESIKENF